MYIHQEKKRTLLLIGFFLYGSLAFSDAQEMLQSQDCEYDTLLIAIIALVPVLVAFTFFVFLFYRKRREASIKLEKSELELEKSELELKALRAQVNPHFIFNCLSSIRHFIRENEKTLAEAYLVKFSHLIRRVLENSTYTMVPLADDLEALELYIQMEQLRLNHSFEYHIDTGEVNTEEVHIPPLLVQPFVENSIWHGITHRKEGGKITITFMQNGNGLHCTIEDNGMERPRSAPRPGYKTKSMGLGLIRQRLKVLGELYEMKADFSIIDLDGDEGSMVGKKVQLVLPTE